MLGHSQTLRLAKIPKMKHIHSDTTIYVVEIVCVFFVKFCFRSGIHKKSLWLDNIELFLPSRYHHHLLSNIRVAWQQAHKESIVLLSTLISFNEF